MTKLKKGLDELNAIGAQKRALTPEEKAIYKNLFSLDPDDTLEVLRWGLKLEGYPCWEIL